MTPATKEEIIQELTETAENLEWAHKKITYKKAHNPLTKNDIELHHVSTILKNAEEIIKSYLPDIARL